MRCIRESAKNTDWPSSEIAKPYLMTFAQGKAKSSASILTHQDAGVCAEEDFASPAGQRVGVGHCARLLDVPDVATRLLKPGRTRTWRCGAGLETQSRNAAGAAVRDQKVAVIGRDSNPRWPAEAPAERAALRPKAAPMRQLLGLKDGQSPVAMF
eukprot:scaffold13474_cov31-Tisochrysis_lutea.AAC.2